MTEVPEFSDDSSIQELAQDDLLSNSSVKGAIKWNKRDNRYDGNCSEPRRPSVREHHAQ